MLGGTVGKAHAGGRSNPRRKDFLEANPSKIRGVLSRFERMIVRGDLPIQDGCAPARGTPGQSTIASTRGRSACSPFSSHAGPSRSRSGRGRPFAQPARRKSLFLYYYLMDPQFCLIPLKVQTWFPMGMPIYLNGHDGLARKLSAGMLLRIEAGIHNPEEFKVRKKVTRSGRRTPGMGTDAQGRARSLPLPRRLAQRQSSLSRCPIDRE